ncbi:MAG: bifunctional riboflavin kinase/FAD synthetase [Phycisphaerae bacterium]
MKVYHGLETITPPIERAVLTIGNFDGVHRAHQQLLAQAGLFAANTRGRVVVMTFDPHPLSVVAPERAPERLSPPDEKLRLLQEAGADIVVVARSDTALLGLEAEAFVRRVIVERFHPTHVVEGPSFGFGRGRAGDPALLRRLSDTYGFAVHIVEPVLLEVDAGASALVSSSLVRRLLGDGRVHRAALCLGRPYTLIGRVVRGRQRGRNLGFPTANVAVTGQLLPADGVYAGQVVVAKPIPPESARYAAAVSIGTAPTFGDGHRVVEAHLLAFDGDLYGRDIRVELIRWLRPQRRFDSAEALTEQLRRDAAAVRCDDGTDVVA